MVDSQELIPAEEIDTLPQLCGCGGKPPTRNVVEPAIRQLNHHDNIGVEINTGLNVGYIPASFNLTRQAELLTSDNDFDFDECTPQAVVGVGVNAQKTKEPSTLAEFLTEEYNQLPQHTSIIKGHTVHVEEESDGFTIVDYFSGSGDARSGGLAANLDIIHALPEQPGTTQARIAILNALNDCYTTGGYRERTVRPIVVHPPGTNVQNSDIEQAYTTAINSDIHLLEPIIVERRLSGWLFGASVTTYLEHTPPTFYNALTPGDEVLLHRPLGALAAYAAVVAGDSEQTTSSIIEPLVTDHQPIARVIASYSPPTAEKFDEKKHLKFATDISGPGIRGLKEPLAESSAAVDLLLTDLPTLDSEFFDQAISRRTRPDLTVETNGPIVLCGTSEVIRQVRDDLEEISIADPTTAGHIINGNGELQTDSIDIEEYVETFSSQD